MADTDRLEGKGKELGGTIQEKVGSLTGDQDLQARGEETKQEGKVQNLWGKVKDTAEEAKDAVGDVFHKHHGEEHRS